MTKTELIKTLKKISKHYFNEKDYTSSSQINRAIDVVQDYQGSLTTAKPKPKAKK
jgi:hypothetical protein